MDSATITAFLAMGFIIFVGFIGSLIFSRFKIPDVLILIGVGMLLGPDILGNQFNIVNEATLQNLNEFKNLFLALALVIILFDGGLSLDIMSVSESMRLSIFISITTFIMSMLMVGFALNSIMNVNLMIALCLGAIVGGTSSAVVLPIVNRMRIHSRTKAMLSMESVITDVMVIVVALTILSIIMIGEINVLSISKDIASKFLIGGGIGLVAGIAWLFVLHRLQKQPLSYMITIGALIIVAALVELPPLSSSGAVAALTFGLAISNREIIGRRLKSDSVTFKINLQIQQFHNEITFFVRTFFFVYLGMFFRFATFTHIHFVAGLLMISMVVLARWVATLMVNRIGNLGFADSMAVFSLMPRGLAAAVLATLPAVMLIGNPIWDDSLGYLFLNTTLLVILGTTIITTILSFATEKSNDFRKRKKIAQNIYNGK
ncbi:MAG: cation:proton antiporter [Thermoplasmata archaeon]|nr:cation:proton antiporter [Thermoplasmata archaeon]